MFLSSPITVIILAETVFLLLVAIFFLALIIRRQRQHHRFLLTEYRKIRRNASIEFGPTALGKLASPSRDDISPDPVVEFLRHARQESLARFQHTARANLPRLSADLPFDAKIAALRYFYILAEQAVHQQQSIRNEAWMSLEKGLADIARWIEKPTALPTPEPDHHAAKLQEAINKLSAAEKENTELHAKLESSLVKQEKMADEHKSRKAALVRLQRIVDVLQLANTYKGEDVETKTLEALLLIDRSQQLTDLDGYYQNSAHQLDNIEELSARKRSVLQNINDSFSYTQKTFPAEQQRKLEGIIKALERDLLVSDNQISQLKNSLKATRGNLKNAAGIIPDTPVTPFNQYSPEKLHSLDSPSMPSSKDIVTIIHHSAKSATDTAPSERDIPQRQQTLEEIEQLRINNQNQRNMIIDFDKELTRLRASLQDTDKVENAETKKNIERLERLVNECERYIETLEHEVNSLHKQLDEDSSKPGTPVTALNTDEESRQKLDALSQQLRRTIKQHAEMGVLNRFYLHAMNCYSLEALAKVLVNSLRDLHVCVGFFLHSTLGKAEFYHHDEFTSEEHKVMQQAAKLAPITRSKDRTLFARSRIGLMLKGLLADDDLQHHLEQTLNNMAQFVDHHIVHLETLAGHHQQLKQAERWIDHTKHSISQLDMQYAFQVEGLQILDSLVQELKRAAGTAEMSDAARTVFNNATGECYQRLQLLLESGKKIDQVSSKLHLALDQLGEKAVQPSKPL